MRYSIEEITFILYNNRSVNGVVKNFVNIENVFLLLDIEKKMDYSKSIVGEETKIEVNLSELNLDVKDIFVYPNDIKNLTKKVRESALNLSTIELEFLHNRGIDDNIISNWKLGGLSYIRDNRDLEILNASCHPMLLKILEDGINEGGIIIPLFENGYLKNCSIRKISDVGKLKYSVACPDIDVWGMEDIKNGDEIWITEGLFDMMAMRSIGVKCVSISGALWSGIQLYKILNLNLSKINIFCDNDRVGIRSGYILKTFFEMFSIDCETYISIECKDASDHIFKNKFSIDSIIKIDIDKKLIESSVDTYNIIEYLKNRKF